MRIAYMLTSLGIGGAEKQVIAVGERMAARGHEVVLIVLRSAEEQECSTKLPVYRVGITKSVPGVVRGLASAGRVLRSFKPDLLHSHTFPANMTARLLRAAGRAPKVISTIHNVYEGDWHRTLAYRVTDRLSICTTAVSQAAADRFIRIKAVPQYKCSVTLNGIDTELFSPSDTKNVTLIAPRPQNVFVWLAAGRDVPAKDFDNLLAAFQIVRSAIPDAQLWIAGRAAAHRTNRSAYEAQGVRWLGVSRDMPSTLAQCDAFVLSSAWEGLPLVIGEAMAMEKPVVATDVGGVRELVGDAGVTVRAKAPAALAEAMLRIMRLSESNRREMGRAGRTRIVQTFEIDSKVDDWERLYSRVLNQP